jgi:hypothetical protein
MFETEPRKKMALFEILVHMDHFWDPKNHPKCLPTPPPSGSSEAMAGQVGFLGLALTFLRASTLQIKVRRLEN